MTVGVMCGCFLSFPRFYQHHLPAFKSILSFLKSIPRSFWFPRRRDQSSDDINPLGIESNSTSKRRITGNNRAIFSSRIGGGRFMSPASVHATDSYWLPPSDSSRTSYTQNNNVPEPTHREHYERMSEEQHSHVQSLSASHDRHARQCQIQSKSPPATDHRHPNSGRVPRTKPSTNDGSTWWKTHRQPNTTRTGYWDVLSFFHTNNTTSPSQSRMQSESGSNAA